jgi:hypothetical protein
MPLSPFLDLDFRAGMNFLTIEVERFFPTITIYCKNGGINLVLKF